jgi:anti-anti-sigma factor
MTAGDQGHELTGGGFDIVIGRFLTTVVVSLRGTLDALAATRLARALRDLIDGQGNLAVAIDLRGVVQVAPSGLQVLSAAAAGLERRNGTLWLSEAPAPVVRALDRANLARLICDPPPCLLSESHGGRGGRQAWLAWSAAEGAARASHPAGAGRSTASKAAHR